MKYDAQQINELLNAYIDGELSERKATELKRLIDHNPELNERLTELQSCKKLAASLPKEQAPDNLADNVITAMERRMILDELSTPQVQTVGVRHLFMKRLAGVAAILLLVAVLGVIIFQVVSPPDTAITPVPVALDNKTSDFKIKVSLTADNITSAKHAIDGILRASDGIDSFASDNLAGINYKFTCKQKDAAAFFSKLTDSWSSFDLQHISMQEKNTTQWVHITNAEMMSQVINLITAGSDAERLDMATAYAKLDDVKNIENIQPIQPRLTSPDDRTDSGILDKTVDIELVITSN